MSNTAGTWTQDTPNSDGQLFLGASEFTPLVAASAVPASSAAGLFSLNITAASTANLFANLNTLLRTGVLASFAGGSQAFGTTGPPPVPGPSSVAHTSGPRGITQKPPILKANLNTIIGPNAEPLPKGAQVNWVDVIYSVATLALTSVTFGLTQTIFKDAVAPAVTNIVALAANGLPTATRATPYRTRITPAAPAMLALDGTEILLNLNFVAPATTVAIFYGVEVGLSYNYN